VTKKVVGVFITFFRAPLQTQNRIIMENTYLQDERYSQTKRGVDEIKGFYGNLASYVL
jgi:hypothetical protein